MSTLRVFIIDELSRATPSELAVLEEITAAKLEQHLADRAKYMRPQTDAASSAGNMVDGSSLPVRENSRYSDSGASNQAASNPTDAGNPSPEKPAFSDECEACKGLLDKDRLEVDYSKGYGVVRPCRVCRSAEWESMMAREHAAEINERRASEVDPWDLASEELVNGGLTSREMVEAEQRYENGLYYYTSRGRVKGQ